MTVYIGRWLWHLLVKYWLIMCAVLFLDHCYPGLCLYLYLSVCVYLSVYLYLSHCMHLCVCVFLSVSVYIGRWLWHLLVKYWLIVCAALFLGIAIQEPVIFNIVYMLLFLIFIILFKVSVAIFIFYHTAGCAGCEHVPKLTPSEGLRCIMYGCAALCSVVEITDI